MLYVYDTGGDLASVTYNDGGTPSVTYTYDRLGRKSSVVCGPTTTSFVYDLAGDVLSESYMGGNLGGLMVTNQFDTYLRRSSLALWNGAAALCQDSYSYDNASRLASLSDGINSAVYSYLANSPLAWQIAFKSNTVTRMTTSKQYDYLNRLGSVSSTPSNAFNYQYNAANQRTVNRLADGSYWRYGYDALGQVTSGNKYWVDQTPLAGQQFDYGFDTIGNRTQAQAGGDQNGANLRVAGSTNSTLNQITSRGVPGYVDVMGDALATNGVTVNGLTAYRKVEYFRQQLSVANASTNVWQGVTNASPGQTSVTGHLYVAKTPENYAYDADGNLLSDGRWSYAWDGENRLLSLTSLTGAAAGSQLQLVFTYDYQGRRLQKIVLTNYNGGYVGEYTNNYAYDGWNCLALLNPSLTLSNSFLWGSDLSGSLQGAGGVGGLLKVTYYGAATTNCFVAFDGNGNVSALINAADGTTLANYDYGPFGEVISATGPMAKLNPFRFSTKFDDDESDFLYYGNRFYNPSIGRWLSRDPAEEDGAVLLRTGRQSDDQFDANGDWIGETDSVNLYAFVAIDALDGFDYLGMCEISTDGRGFTIVTVEKNEIVWWIYHSNKRNPVFIPPWGTNGAAGDLGCFAAYQNQRIAKIHNFLIPAAPTAMEEQWDSKVNPITDQAAFKPAVQAMGQGTVQLVNSWLGAGNNSCPLSVKVTIVDATGFFGAESPPKVKSYIFTKPIKSFSPYTGGQ